MKIWLGVLFVVLAICVMFWGGDTNNNLTHYTRKYRD